MKWLVAVILLIPINVFACSNTFSLIDLPCNMGTGDAALYGAGQLLNIADFLQSKQIQYRKPYYEDGCMKDCVLKDIQEGNPIIKKMRRNKTKN